MSTIDAPRSGAGRSAKTQLIDLHFDVRNTIAEVLAEPTSAGRLALRRALDRFFSAERTFASIGESVIDQADVEAAREQLLRSLQMLDTAAHRDGVRRAAESLRSTFLALCHPLWQSGMPTRHTRENDERDPRCSP